MIDHTILVVDASEETEEAIVSTLEAQGYLVFTASGRDISTGLAEKISPSLIYVKPAAISVEGFATCKLIHHTEKFKKVPILLLASLKGPLDPRYTTFYGVLDYLKLPLDPEEVLKKTAKILGNQSHDIQVPDDDFGLDEEESSPYEEAPLLEEPHVVDSDPGDRSSDMQAPEDEFGLTEEAIVPVDEKPGYGTEHAGETETDKILDIGQ
ncbi:MAG: response regulator, partial [Nitrospirae bacterium]|nr:response regulator [Nitrospirota bacterium]